MRNPSGIKLRNGKLTNKYRNEIRINWSKFEQQKRSRAKRKLTTPMLSITITDIKT